MFDVGAIYALWLAVVSWAGGEFVAAGVGGVAAVLLLTRGQKIFRIPIVLQHTMPSQALKPTAGRSDV